MMPQKADANFTLEKSLIDHRSYKFFTLGNGMRVIVISSLKAGEDPSFEPSSDEDASEDLDDSDIPEATDDMEEVCEVMENKSAAALCIQVGCLSDPVEAQGLSHFLEHMVFMGSKKYPTENDFDAYLSKRGGTTNAWTGSEYTLFHFDVKRKHFAKCLDRFAQFFISPLLESSSTDRELSAVHSEFELANARDSSRLQFFLGTLACEDSPFRLFGYGNISSLREIPKQNGTDIEFLLHRHREQSYSAHRMTLALHSKDTLENLEKLARDLFSDVPNRSAPMGIISSLLGHEGQGSALALLKEKNLAVSLACGITPTSDIENSSLCTLFVVYITLTDIGRDNVFDVCLIVFDYMKMLLQSAVASQQKSNTNGTAFCNHHQVQVDDRTDAEREVHTFDSYLPEYQSTRKAAFLYSEPQEPEDTVVHVANMMHLVPPHHVFSGYNLLKQVDMSLYVDILKLFTADRAAIILLSAHFATSLPKDAPLQVEPWFKIRYMVEDIPSTLMQQWKNSIPSPVLHLPYKNKYITTDFTLLPSNQDMKEPRDLNAAPGAEERRRFGHLWFQQSTRFQSPKVTFFDRFSYFFCRLSQTSPHSLRDYPHVVPTGGQVQRKCFYQTILDHIVDDNTETSTSHFEAYRDAIRQLYFNEALKPKVLNTHLQFYLLRKDAFLLDDLLSAVRRLTVSDLMAYKQRFFASLRITAYVHGNLTEKTDVANLDAGTYQLRVMNCNPSDVNMCVARVHLLGCTDLVRDTYNQLLAVRFRARFGFYCIFYRNRRCITVRTIRTRVISTCVRLRSPDGNSRSGISVVACSQANNFSASHVAGRLTAFWYRLAPHLLAGIPQDAFQTALEDPNMVTEVDRNWEEILIGDAMFNRREASVKVLRTVTKEALLNFFIDEYMDPARRRSLLIQASGLNRLPTYLFCASGLSVRVLLLVDAFPTPDPDYVMPSKPSSLFIKHIKMNSDLIADENRSAREVIVPDTVDAIGFDAKLARKVLGRLNSKLLGDDGCSSLDESPVCIDNVRDFRSKLHWEAGRVL
ncbi:Nardilysin [Fasciola gigantica]|uniref:Nardilysin n=1 Tax=Fasciola gigantica TaxID=46835 RepID=A0A504YB95_FASGI|nr:Nardilysin [Fasciola gigantica]